MPGHDEKAMSHGHQGTPLTQTRGPSAVLGREIGGLRPRSRPGRLGPGAAHIDVSLAGVARPLVPRRRVVAGTPAGPRGEVASGRQGRRVGADFSAQHFRKELERIQLLLALDASRPSHRVVRPPRPGGQGHVDRPCLGNLRRTTGPLSENRLKLCEVASCGRIFWAPMVTINVARSTRGLRRGLTSVEGAAG
jgi:hypothetical protein